MSPRQHTRLQIPTFKSTAFKSRHNLIEPSAGILVLFHGVLPPLSYVLIVRTLPSGNSIAVISVQTSHGPVWAGLETVVTSMSSITPYHLSLRSARPAAARACRHTHAAASTASAAGASARFRKCCPLPACRGRCTCAAAGSASADVIRQCVRHDASPAFCCFSHSSKAFTFSGSRKNSIMSLRNCSIAFLLS